MNVSIRRRSIPALAASVYAGAGAQETPPMKTVRHLNSDDLPKPTGNYTHGTLAQAARQLIFVSGQVAWSDANGKGPRDFDVQCNLVWKHVESVLREGGMQLGDLIKITTFLSSRAHRAANSRIREQVLGKHTPAVTIVICDIYSPDWLLEIEGIAAR